MYLVVEIQLQKHATACGNHADNRNGLHFIQQKCPLLFYCIFVDTYKVQSAVFFGNLKHLKHE